MSGAQVRSIVGLSALGPGRPVTSRIRKPDGRTDEIPRTHTEPPDTTAKPGKDI